MLDFIKKLIEKIAYFVALYYKNKADNLQKDKEKQDVKAKTIKRLTEKRYQEAQKRIDNLKKEWYDFLQKSKQKKKK